MSDKAFYELLNERIGRQSYILKSGTGRAVTNKKGRLRSHEKNLPFGMKIKAFRGILTETKSLLRKEINRFDCPPGCHDCCNRIPIITSRLEYEYLSREIVRNFRAKEQGESRYSSVYRIWKKFCNVYGVRHGVPFIPISIVRSWADLDIPCIFHDENGCMLKDKPVECLFLRRTETPCTSIIENLIGMSDWIRVAERSSFESGMMEYLATRSYLQELQRPIGSEETFLEVLRRWCHTIDTWVYPNKTKFIPMPIFSLLGPPR